ncbi:hypothetical protein C0995_008753 [Termitomyces sp. Mi166|nr:hypothetical protein C0995_008753 [Termitomyces sp. Mi166\
MSLLPPPCTSRTDDTAIDAVRKRLTAKSRRFVSLSNLKSKSQPKTLPSTQYVTEPISPSSSISLDSTSLDTSDSFTDKYKWAVVYENQRGLLPFDPPPFTIPNTSPSSKQANISLADYPLPDGTWRWVSKCWMIDMRSDTGEVQHDGFEYNCVFRTHKWSAEVGSFSAGGWVRRRRWIRLMMRPARPQFLHDHGPEGRAASSFSQLVKTPQSDVPHNLLDVDVGWTKEDVKGNWHKCCSLMKYLGRDGRKLELWKLWLSLHPPEYPSRWLGKGEMSKGKAQHVDLTDDDTMTSNATGLTSVFAHTPKKLRALPNEHLIPILRLHGNELLHTFVYPESRANFMTMLREAGLLHVLEVEPGFSASGMDFWSYVDGMHTESSHKSRSTELQPMSSRSWIHSHPVQAALRTYALSLSLSLGPSLLPFLTALITGRSSRKTNFQAFIRVLRRELGLDGFAFAMTLSVGGGLALHELWAVHGDEPKQPEPLSQHRRLIASLSPSQKAFITNIVSSSFGILLLQAGRRRFYRLRQEFLSPVVTLPFTPPTPTPESRIRISDTLDLTLLLLVRAADSLLQTYIRKATLMKHATSAETRVSQKRGTKAATTLTSRIDAFLFWACSARIMWCFFYEPERYVRLLYLEYSSLTLYRLPKSYVKWIATLANLDGRVIQALQLLRKGDWSYTRGSTANSAVLTGLSHELGYNTSWGNPEVLPAYGGAVADTTWKALGVKNRRGVGGIPCEIVHGSIGSSLGLEGSCVANSFIRGVMAFLEAIVIYLPVRYYPHFFYSTQLTS